MFRITPCRSGGGAVPVAAEPALEKAIFIKNKATTVFFVVVQKGRCLTVFLCGSFCFLSAAPPAPAGGSVPPYSPPAKRRFCPPHLWPGVPREWPSVLPKGRTLPEKKRRKAAPAIYSAVSYRFYNVFCKKGFTNEFQKHII